MLVLKYMRQKTRKWRLCDDRDEKVNHIINESINLAQKEDKIRHDSVGKVIRRDLC